MLRSLRSYSLLSVLFLDALAAPQARGTNGTHSAEGKISPTELGDGPSTMTDLISQRMDALQRIWPNPLRIKAIWAYPRDSSAGATPGDFIHINIDMYDTIQRRFYQTGNTVQDPTDWTAPKVASMQSATGFKLFNWQQRQSTLEEQMGYLAEAGEPRRAYLNIGLYIPDQVHGLPLHLDQIYWLYHLGQNRRFGQGDLDHKVHGRSYRSSDEPSSWDASLNLTGIEPEQVVQVA